MLRSLGVLAIAFMAAIGLGFAGPGPVNAECPYLPPWPHITDAIPTARQIVVGRVVTEFDQRDLVRRTGSRPRDIALRVTHVIRGDLQRGDLLDIQFLAPNWPQVRYTAGEPPLASCTSLHAAPGDVIALALGARQAPRRVHDELGVWNRPAVRYNAIGVIAARAVDPNEGDFPERGRERVTLAQLQRLSGLPATDAVSAAPRLGAPGRFDAAGLVLVAAALAGAGAWLRPGRRAGRPPRPRRTTASGS